MSPLQKISIFGLIGVGLWCATAASAATVGPPMLDIATQCNAMSRHNATAMSECVVAESEARSELLQKWNRLSDASVERCVKLGRKARKYPYATIAKCLAVDEGPVRPASPTTAAAK